MFRFPVRLATVVVLLGSAFAFAADRTPPSIRVERLPGNPIITEQMLPGTDGESLNGPSLIRVPSWVKNPLGRYYLYFGHHQGKYIRLAYADRVEGPWQIREGGSLRMDQQSVLNGHIASPTAVVDEKSERIFLFYHGRPATFKKKDITGPDRDPEAGQKTSVAVSTDGLAFTPIDTIVAGAYLQVFPHDGRWFALNQTGELRVADRLGEPFQLVANILGEDIAASVDPFKLHEPGASADRPAHGADRYSIRHVGTDLAGGWLMIYFTCVGHRPERILCTAVDLAGPPAAWKAHGVVDVLRPEKDWEGGKLPLAFSKGGRSPQPENALRDPAIFRDGPDTWLVYAGAGEHALGLARLTYTFSRE